MEDTMNTNDTHGAGHTINRRHLLAGIAGTTALAASVAARPNLMAARPQRMMAVGANTRRLREMAQDASPEAQPDMTGAVYTFQVGDLTCHAVSDGATIDTFLLDLFYARTPPERAEEIIMGIGWDNTLPENHHTSIVIDTGDHLVLVDTGYGPDVTPNEGLLLENLEVAGIAPEDIDVVVLTHAHPDHIGGNLDADGNPVFANARYVMSQEDWDFWSDRPRVEEAMAYAPDFAQLLLGFVDRQLLPLETSIELIGYDEEIVPGVTSIAARGHTPGHMALLVQSGEEKLWVAGDLGFGELTARYPDAFIVPDIDLEQLLETRLQLFARFAEEGGLVAFSHAEPFPGMGHLVADGDAWAWESVETVTQAIPRSRQTAW
jgi:glyoxylase-like metal-dependent hydrolase (beta-lactamase superfamily II)